MSAWRLGPYRAVGHRFTIEGHGAEQVRLRLAHAMEPLADPGGTPGSTYGVTDHGADSPSRFALDIDGTPIHSTDSPYHLAGLLVWHVNGSVVRVDRGQHLLLHAAAAERDGVTVVLPAPMESGKTTTVAGLLRAGFRYITDETVVLDRDDLSITAFPKALALDRSAAGLVGGIALPDYRHAGSDPQQHVRWADLGGAGVCERAQPGLVVFPRYTRGAKTVAEPVAPSSAVLELAASTFEFRRRPRRNLDALARLATVVPAYRLAIGDLQEAVLVISSLVKDGARAAVPA